MLLRHFPNAPLQGRFIWWGNNKVSSKPRSEWFCRLKFWPQWVRPKLKDAQSHCVRGYRVPRMLQAIYRQHKWAPRQESPLGNMFKLKIWKISDINNSWACTLKTLRNLEYCHLANYSLLWKLFTDKLSILDFHLRYDFQLTAELKVLCVIISSCSWWSL